MIQDSNMNKEWSFTGVLPLRAAPGLGFTLKRLALFCDEIQLLMPTIPAIEKRVFDDPSRVQEDSDGKKYLKDFNYHRDVTHLHFTMKSAVERFQGEDRHTLQAFVDSRIVKAFKEDIIPPEQQDYLKDFRRLMISCDVNDSEFNRLCGTKPEDYAVGGPMTEIIMKKEEELEVDGKEISFLYFKEPLAVMDSYDLTTSLIASEICGFQPVFPEPRHRQELVYKYSRYQKGVEVLRELDGGQIKTTSSNWRFGEAAYLLSNMLFSSTMLAEKSVEDVIRYRNAMREARVRFVSTSLFELTQIIENSPWGKSTHREVEKFVRAKLMPELGKYQDKSKEIWEKLFGSLTVNLANLGRSMTIGSASGGLLGSVIPGTTAWGMLALGALAGASKEAPKIAENLVKLILDLRKHRRNSIAYIADFK